jgi:hypothetical protein
LTAFPVVDFLVVLLAELYLHPWVAMVAMPAAFGLGALALCRMIRASFAATVAIALGCAALCFAASGAALLVGVFASFYSEF